jgi:capsule polysaccharide export protein KpsC/LpsZ
MEIKFRISDRLKEMFPEEDFEYTVHIINEEYEDIKVTWEEDGERQIEFYFKEEVKENFKNGNWVKL